MEYESSLQQNNYCSDEFSRYMQSIVKYPLLTEEEEVDLTVKAKAGDRSAFNRLVNCNLRLVVKVAGKYRCNCDDFFDLIQAGNVGLLEAAKRFDVSFGCRFSSYAYYWIKKECVDYLAEMQYHISLRPALYNAINRIITVSAENLCKTVDTLTQSDIQKIASVTNISEKTICRYVNVCAPVYSIDAMIGEDDDRQICELTQDTSRLPPEEEFITEELYGDIRSAIQTLCPLEANVIRERFGFNDGDPKTLRELGNKMGRSRESIRLKEARAISLLRKGMNNNEK